MADEPRAADREDWRLIGRLAVPSRFQQRDADQPIACERVLHHLPVAHLEDVQRQEHAREEDDVRQREDRDD